MGHHRPQIGITGSHSSLHRVPVRVVSHLNGEGACPPDAPEALEAIQDIPGPSILPPTALRPGIGACPPNAPEALEADLTAPEIVGLRLYTGPPRGAALATLAESHSSNPLEGDWPFSHRCSWNLVTKYPDFIHNHNFHLRVRFSNPPLCGSVCCFETPTHFSIGPHAPPGPGVRGPEPQPPGQQRPFRRGRASPLFCYPSGPDCPPSTTLPIALHSSHCAEAGLLSPSPLPLLPRYPPSSEWRPDGDAVLHRLRSGQAGPVRLRGRHPVAQGPLATVPFTDSAKTSVTSRCSASRCAEIKGPTFILPEFQNKSRHFFTFPCLQQIFFPVKIFTFERFLWFFLLMFSRLFRVHNWKLQFYKTMFVCCLCAWCLCACMPTVFVCQIYRSSLRPVQ